MQECGCGNLNFNVDTHLLYDSTQFLCYTDIIDEPELPEKETIAYITDPNNFQRLLRRICRTKGVDMSTAGDIMHSVYEELLRKDDFEILWDEDEPSKVMTLENFVSCVINICCKRYFSEEHKRRQMECSDTCTIDSGAEGSIFNLMPSNSNENELEAFEWELDSAMRWGVTHRYYGKCDMLAVVYASLLAKNKEQFKRITKVMGMDLECNYYLKKWLTTDEDALYFLKSILKDVEEGIKALEKHVYGAKLINKALIEA